jgi:general secretion pathway protein G
MNENSNSNENPPPVARVKIRWGALLGVLILAFILAMVLTPQIGRGPRGEPASAKADIATFGSALDMFKVDNGYFPQGANGLVYLVQRPPGATNWQGPYLADKTTVPLDPWGHDYNYECPGRHNPQSFDLSSMGPDGRAGTEDDICNWKR